MPRSPIGWRLCNTANNLTIYIVGTGAYFAPGEGIGGEDFKGAWSFDHRRRFDPCLFSGLPGRYLGDEANVCDCRRLAMAKASACGVFGEQCLHRLQARAKPMLDPGKPLLVADLQHVG